MQVAVFGDQRATVPPDWTEETAVALAGDVRIDASRGNRFRCPAHLHRDCR